MAVSGRSDPGYASLWHRWLLPELYRFRRLAEPEAGSPLPVFLWGRLNWTAWPAAILCGTALVILLAQGMVRESVPTAGKPVVPPVTQRALPARAPPSPAATPAQRSVPAIGAAAQSQAPPPQAAGTQATKAEPQQQKSATPTAATQKSNAQPTAK